VVVHVFSVRLLTLLLNPLNEIEKSDNFNQIFGIIWVEIGGNIILQQQSSRDFAAVFGSPSMGIF
jgi:hypothetical protein